MRKERLERQLKRTKELYEWGDYSKAEYETHRDKILDQFRIITMPQRPAEHLEKMARFLADVTVWIVGLLWQNTVQWWAPYLFAMARVL